jgi:acetolactate synthase-1/2/3 large subunit
VDIDMAEIGKNVATRFGLHANSRDFLEFACRSDLEGRDTTAWREEISDQRSRQERQPDVLGSSLVSPRHFMEALSRATSDRGTVVTGVGQHQMWAALFYSYQRPRQWISSGGLGTMGFGVPAAIGAHFAKANQPIVCIDGDGSFQMNIQELATIAANRIPVKIFVLNNGYLGMVRQWEDLFNDGQHYETCLARTDVCDPACVEVKECRTPNPNLLNLGSVYPGIKTLRIAKAEDVEPGIEQALRDDRPYVVDVWIERTEDVKPMIPPGGGLSDIICD